MMIVERDGMIIGFPKDLPDEYSKKIQAAFRWLGQRPVEDESSSPYVEDWFAFSGIAAS